MPSFCMSILFKGEIKMKEENNLIGENSLIVPEDDIKNIIYTIRGKQVILDRDLAKLYNCKNGTKTINQAVKRNMERFPERFLFQLNEKEYYNLWSQFGTTSENETLKYRRKEHLPYAFTEQGVAMLATIIKTNVAVDVSIKIMDAFVEMRKFMINNLQLFERLTNVEYKLLEYDKKFDTIFNALQKNKKEEFKEKIFFEGQIYDAYNLIVKIIKMAKEKITIIDNYIDQSILEMITKKNKGVEVVILTSNNCNITKLDIQKFNRQYPKLSMSKTNSFHDRFIIIDNKILYHCGASLKDLGKKCFAITKMEDDNFIDRIKYYNKF